MLTGKLYKKGSKSSERWAYPSQKAQRGATNQKSAATSQLSMFTGPGGYPIYVSDQEFADETGSDISEKLSGGRL